MLAVFDRHVRHWHLVAANAVALTWFVAMTVVSRLALPDVALFRCPVGFCAGGYTREELRGTLDLIGEDGREYLRDTLLPLDLALPALLLVALVISYVWFSRPGEPGTVALSAGARYGLLAVPVLYAIADYGENWAVARLLDAYPAIDDALAGRASFLTACKSQLVALSIGIAGALAVVGWGSAHGYRRNGDHPPSGRR